MSDLALKLIDDTYQNKSTFLDLGYCGLTSIPPEIEKLKDFVENINLGNFSRLGKRYVKSQNGLSPNRYKDTDAHFDVLQKFSKLKKLTLVQCGLRLSAVDKIGQFSDINSLDISHNGIGDKGAEYVSRMNGLTILYIESNKIGDKGAEYVSRMSGLRELYIGYNGIGNEGACFLGNLKKLKDLDLTDNIVNSIPIYLIESIPLEIDIWDEYRSNCINLAKNSITDPPEEVLRQGRSAILDHLKGDLKPLNECKMIFVGDGGVGKTSLMKRLVYGEFNKNEKQTHGINKIAWKDLKNEKGENIKVNLWDFGGQHIQHSLHQFFFSKQVMYILVLDPRNDQNAFYWLDQIEKLGSDSKIFIIYNWKDEKDKQAYSLINFYELRKKYPQLSEPSLLSCATGEGVSEFKEVLENAIFENEALKTKYRSEWFNIKSRLETEIPIEKNYIEYAEYEKWCADEHYDDPGSKKTLLRILDSIGSIVFFDKPILDQLQVLNPEWITTGAYAILTSGKTRETQGHLHWDDFKEIFAEKKEIFSDKEIRIKYEERHFHFILELMLEYGLCQKNPFEKNTYLIPSAFGEQPPEDYKEEVEGGRQYRLQFESPFEMLIIHRFIAKNIVNITSNDYWNSGIYFKHSASNTYALVDTNLYSKQINCSIKGDNIRGLWEVIRNDFRDIFKMYHNFPVREEVLYSSDGKNVFLPYDEMLNSLKNGIYTIPYHPTYQLKDIDVRQVLERFESPQQTQQNIRSEQIIIEVRPEITVSPTITANPQTNPQITVNPQINNNTEIKKNSLPGSKGASASSNTNTPEEDAKVRAWKQRSRTTLIVSLIITVALMLIYINKWLFADEFWQAVKDYDIVKWGSLVGAILWNGFIIKSVYERYYDPTKEKAYRENLRQKRK